MALLVVVGEGAKAFLTLFFLEPMCVRLGTVAVGNEWLWWLLSRLHSKVPVRAFATTYTHSDSKLS